MTGGDAQIPTQQTTAALKRAASDEPGAPRARPKAKSNVSVHPLVRERRPPQSARDSCGRKVPQFVWLLPGVSVSCAMEFALWTPSTSTSAPNHGHQMFEPTSQRHAMLSRPRPL
eukprot:6378386-Amphidinium_carterae.1